MSHFVIVESYPDGRADFPVSVVSSRKEAEAKLASLNRSGGNFRIEEMSINQAMDWTESFLPSVKNGIALIPNYYKQ